MYSRPPITHEPANHSRPPITHEPPITLGQTITLGQHLYSYRLLPENIFIDHAPMSYARKCRDDPSGVYMSQTPIGYRSISASLSTQELNESGFPNHLTSDLFPRFLRIVSILNISWAVFCSSCS